MSTTQGQIDHLENQVANIYRLFGISDLKDEPIIDPATTGLTVRALRIQPERECKLRQYEDQTLASSSGVAPSITESAVRAGTVVSQTTVAALVSSDPEDAALVTLAATQNEALPTHAALTTLNVDLSELRDKMNLTFAGRLSHGGQVILRPTNTHTGFEKQNYNTAPKPAGTPNWTRELVDAVVAGFDGVADHGLPSTNKATEGKQPYTSVANRALAEFHALRSLNLAVGQSRPTFSLFVDAEMAVDRHTMPLEMRENITVSRSILGDRGTYADYSIEYSSGKAFTYTPASMSVNLSPGSAGDLRLYDDDGRSFDLDDSASTSMRGIMSVAQKASSVNNGIESDTFSTEFSGSSGITMLQGSPDDLLFDITGTLDTAIVDMKNIDSPLFLNLIGTESARKSTTIGITAVAPERISDPDADGTGALLISDVATTWVTENGETSRDLAMVTSNPRQDSKADGFLTVDANPPNTNDSSVDWTIDVAALQAAPGVTQTTGNIGTHSLRDYNAAYTLAPISTEGSSALHNGTSNSPPGDSMASITTPISSATMLSELTAIIPASAGVQGEFRLRNIKPRQVNGSEDTIMFPTAGKTPAQVTDVPAEWEATVSGEVIVTGSLANPRSHPALMVATINTIASSVSHKYVGVEGWQNEVIHSLIENKAEPKLNTPSCSEIYNDERQNGVPPRKTTDGNITIEIHLSDIGAGTAALPAFAVYSIERGVAATGVDVIIDGANTENRSTNWLDSDSSSKDIVYKYIGAYTQGSGNDLENLEYVDVSIYVAGLNGFVRFSPLGVATAGPARAALWADAQNAAEFAQVDIANSAFLNVSVDFYEYPVVRWLDTKPDLTALNKIGGTSKTGVSWTNMVAGQPDPGSQPALLSDAGGGTNNIGLSFVRTHNRSSLHPGTQAYCVFGNSDSFTYDLEYITVTDDFRDYSKQATHLYSRGRAATLGRPSPPDSGVGLLSFAGLSLQLTMSQHMTTNDSLSVSLTTHDLVVLTRTTIGGGNYIDGSITFFWDGATISPLSDGVTLTKKSTLLAHTRQTVSQSHGAPGYVGDPANPPDGPGTYIFHQGLTPRRRTAGKALEVVVPYVRGYYQNNGTIRVHRDTFSIDDLSTQAGHTEGGLGITLTYGGIFTPTYTHYPADQNYAWRYALTQVSIDGGPQFELDGTRRLRGFDTNAKYGAGNVWGDVFQNVLLADPLISGTLAMTIAGDNIDGIQLSDMRTENALFGAPYALQSDVDFLPVDIGASGFVLKLTPPRLRVYSTDYKRYDLDTVDETIVINSSLSKYQATDLAATVDLGLINPFDLVLGEVMHLAASPTTMEILFKHAATEYTSSEASPIPLSGQYDLSMWKNPNGGEAGQTLREDTHVRLNVSSRSLPWDVELAIQGGSYRVARYSEAGGNYSLVAQSNGFDLTGSEEGEICRFLDSDDNEMGIEIIIHAGFWAEADRYEGFAWQVNRMPTPFRVNAPKTYELNNNDARVGPTHTGTVEDLLLVTEATIRGRAADVSVVAEDFDTK
jgi:hypothetical protein